MVAVRPAASEAIRQAIHASNVWLVALVGAAGLAWSTMAAAVILVGLLCLELYRWSEAGGARIRRSWLGRVIRPHEETRWLGSTNLYRGIVLTLLLGFLIERFGLSGTVHIATYVQAALLLVILGDAISGFVARRLGGPAVPNGRHYGGILAFVAVGALAAAVLPLPLGTGLLLGLVAGAVELLTPRSLDDNITVPLVSLVAALLVG